MKIKNEYVQIKNGRTYDFRNTITSDYLKLFNKSQIDDDYKLQSDKKAFKYVYIKTGDVEHDERENNNKNYYNLINVNDVIDNGNGLFKVITDDWIKFDGKSLTENIDSTIEFNDNGLVSKYTDIRLLIEIKNIVFPERRYNELRIMNDTFIRFEPDSSEYRMIFGITREGFKDIKKNKDGHYLFEVHRHDWGYYYSDTSLYKQIFEGVPKGVSFEFRISLIKEENNETTYKEIALSDYKYNPYIDFSNLASDYNYKLPVNSSYYESNNARVDTYYTFDNNSGFYKSDGTAFSKTTNINELANQQILQLAFGNDNNIYAFVDISDSNIIVESDVGLYIYRKDIVISDASFSGDLIPAHLSPLGCQIGEETYYGELYSIGLGFARGEMNEEYLIKDNPVEEIDDNTYRITLKKGINDTLIPHENLYPNVNLMPVLETHIGNEIYPDKRLFPNEKLYPCVAKYKYVMYKYRLFKIENSQIKPIDKYYIMNFYTENKGTTRIDTKYERS